jgi:hypothetical protein
MKHIDLAGLGRINIFGIDFKTEEGTTCDSKGNPVEYKIEGKGKGTYRRVSDGSVLKKTEIYKKLNINNEEIIASSLTPTTSIEAEDIQVIDEKDNVSMKKACERKSYVAMTSSQEIKKLLNEGKSIMFPVVVGTGFKIWKGIVQKWTTENGKEAIALFCCRGNIDKAFEEFDDNPIMLNLDAVPKENAKNIRKLFKQI